MEPLSTPPLLGALLTVPPLVVGLVALVRARRYAARVGALDDVAPLRDGETPTVSVVVAARDEAEHVEATLRSLLALDYDALEVVLVDDRSTDGTGDVARAVGADDDRLQVVRVDELPDGWLGKVHALREGCRRATGEYLLFTDADVRFAPDALRRAVGHAWRGDLDLLAVVPLLRPTSLLLDATLGASLRNFALTVAAWRIRDPGSRAHMGVGGFNLLRRRALEREDLFEWLRMEPVDDVGLARRVKETGGRCDLLAGGESVSLTWYASVGAMARGLEKNLFGAVAGYSAVRLVLAVGLMVWCFVLPPILIALPLGPVWRAAAALSVLASMAAAATMERWSGRSPAAALLTPLGDVLLVWMTVRAGVLALVRGGIVWRGTLYPLDALRRLRRVRFP